MRTDIEPPIYGDIPEETAADCQKLSCRLLKWVKRDEINFPTCAVLCEMDNNRPRFIAVQNYRSTIPSDCPEGFTAVTDA